MITTRDIAWAIMWILIAAVSVWLMVVLCILPMMGAPTIPDFVNITNLEGGLV